MEHFGYLMQTVLDTVLLNVDTQYIGSRCLHTDASIIATHCILVLLSRRHGIFPKQKSQKDVMQQCWNSVLVATPAMAQS